MDFSKNPYFEKVDKVNLIERWILIHSILYYVVNTNLVSDGTFDDNGLRLVRYIKRWPETFKKSRYYKTFKKFEGSTGFDLIDRLKKFDYEEYNNLIVTAIWLLETKTLKYLKKNKILS